jgi:ferredoxin
MTMKIHVDMTLCEYHGQCEYFAPEIFRIDEDKLVYVAEPDESLRDKVTKAARACPQLAIKIVE